MGGKPLNRQQKEGTAAEANLSQLMGIRQLTDHGAKTARRGSWSFFMIKPDNLSVLSGEGIRSRVKI